MHRTVRRAARTAIALAVLLPLLAWPPARPAAAAAPTTATFVDHLDDWSRTSAHAGPLALDKAGPDRFGGDSSRAARTATAAAEVVWFGYGIRSFHAVAYHRPGDPVAHLGFATSADGTTWRAATPTITGGSGSWPRYDYRLSGLTDVNHVKVTWSGATTAQLADVDFTAAPIASYADPLDSWARSYDHGASWAVWRAVGTFTFHAAAQPGAALGFETSYDAVTWQRVTPLVAAGHHYLLFLANVNYVRVSWTGSSPPLTGVDWTTVPTNVVQRFGPTLVLDGNPYRYSGANVFWLGVAARRSGSAIVPFTPSRFRIDDALATVVEMGGTVVRSTSLGTSVGCPVCIEPTLGIWNEAALRQVDLVVARAAAHGVRLVLPLTDPHEAFFGGNHTFEDWRGAPAGAFYTDPTIIADFKAYISRLVTRVNTITGVAYRDDPTILAWETGNEVVPPRAWTQEITRHLRALDPKHLVIDGTYGVDTGAVALPTTDAVSDHFYPMDTGRLGTDLWAAGLGAKPLIVGEYGWSLTTGTDLTTWLEVLRAYPGVVGDTYWHLFGHADTAGFAQHNDGYTIHFPGDTVGMRETVDALRTHAYGMRSAPVPAHAVPGAPGEPVFVGFVLGYVIYTWRGAPLADRYLIQYAPSAAGPWTDACAGSACPTDNAVPGVIGPLPLGSTWFRVQALNVDGVGGPVVHPATNPVLVA